jgi:hypothetical protein
MHGLQTFLRGILGDGRDQQRIEGEKRVNWMLMSSLKESR